MAAKFVWIFLSVAWGTTWLAITIGLEDLPPITFAGVRFLVGAAVLWAVLFFRGFRLPANRTEWLIVVRTGTLIFVFNYALQFWGMQYVTSGLTSVMFSTVPVFTLVFAHFSIRSEPMTRGKLAGVGLGVAGVGVIFSDQLVVQSPFTVAGCVAFLVGAAGMARAQVDLKAHGAKLDPAAVAAIQMTFGSIALLSMGWTFEGSPFSVRWTSSAVLAVLYLAVIGSAVGFFAFYWLLTRIPVARASAMMLVHPVVAIILGVVFRDEPLTWHIFAGAAAIMSGLALVLRPDRRPASRNADTVVTGQHAACEV